VAGAGLVFAVAAVLAVAVGILIRQTAGAVSLLLVWVLLAEHLVGLIPDVGQDISRWLPFMNANQFLTGEMPGMPFGPWGSLAYFAALAAGVLAVALVAADRRDA
jgi:ABC-2 type transport system permease protein